MGTEGGYHTVGEWWEEEIGVHHPRKVVLFPPSGPRGGWWLELLTYHPPESLPPKRPQIETRGGRLHILPDPIWDGLGGQDRPRLSSETGRRDQSAVGGQLIQVDPATDCDTSRHRGPPFCPLCVLTLCTPDTLTSPYRRHRACPAQRALLLIIGGRRTAGSSPPLLYDSEREGVSHQRYRVSS